MTAQSEKSLNAPSHAVLIRHIKLIGFEGKNNILRASLIAVVGSLLLWASAKVQVPFWPVPMTMQVFAVLAIGMLCGARLAMATVVLYLLQGAAGLPVFATGGGLPYILGPTGGYLLGFLFAATLCGWLAERGWDRHFLTSLLTAFIGVGVIYACGLLWLGSVVGWDKPILAFGFYPFVLGDVAKAILAALLLPFAWRFVK